MAPRDLRAASALLAAPIDAAAVHEALAAMQLVYTAGVPPTSTLARRVARDVQHRENATTHSVCAALRDVAASLQAVHTDLEDVRADAREALTETSAAAAACAALSTQAAALQAQRYVWVCVRSLLLQRRRARVRGAGRAPRRSDAPGRRRRACADVA